MQLDLFSISENNSRQNIKLDELFEAYYNCRKNKRNTINALAFEIDYEKNLVQLYNDINDRSYKIGQSMAFIVNKPVKREIFAADFRDRIVHHWLISKLNPIFEKEFINDSYACRFGKGTHFGIARVDGFIKSCSKNYTIDCYVLKLDVLGFFMHINRIHLWEKVHAFIKLKYKQNDIDLIIEICRKIIFNDSAKNCFIKGHQSDWNGLPINKSLFHSPVDCGLPIGNLTSQVFANFYMNSFDHFVKSTLNIRYYGRYVDDFVIIHTDKNYLVQIQKEILNFLQIKLQLTLHPKKVHLQHFNKGVQFLGTYIKPYRIYIAKRTKGNFYNAIKNQNDVVRLNKPSKNEINYFLSVMNSYLGIMKHYDTFKLRKRMVFKNISGWWLNYASLKGGIAKFMIKNKKVKNKFIHYKKSKAPQTHQQ